METPQWAGCAKLSEALGSWPATLGEVRTPQEYTKHSGGPGERPASLRSLQAACSLIPIARGMGLQPTALLAVLRLHGLCGSLLSHLSDLALTVVWIPSAVPLGPPGARPLVETNCIPLCSCTHVHVFSL